MPEFIHLLIQDGWKWVGLMGEMAVKTTIILAAALTFLIFGRRISPAIRHLILTFAVASLLLLPFVSSILPDWNFSLLPSVLPQASQSGYVETPEQIIPLPISAPPKTSFLSSPPTAQSSTREPVDWPFWIFLIWTAGASIVLVRLIAAAIGTKLLVHRASPTEDHHLGHLLAVHALQMGIKRKISLLHAPGVTVPLTCGWLHPSILLPPESSSWPEKRKEIVLLHELAHIKRGDFLLSILTRIVCFLYWFNPLVWIAIKKIAVEREHASDDCVILAGIKASDYASHLLEIAKRVSVMRWFSPAGITIAKKSNLEVRIMSILNNKKPTGQIKFSTLIFVGLMVFSLILPVASLNTWAQSEKSQEKEQTQIKETEKAEEGLSPQEKEELRRVLKEFFDYIEKLDFSKAITFFDDLDLESTEDTPLVIIKKSKNADAKNIVVLGVDDLKKVKVKTDVRTIVKKLQNVAVVGNISVVGTDKDNKKTILIKNDGQAITLKKKDGKWKIIADALQLNFIKDDVDKESETIGLAITDEGVTYTIIRVSPSITIVKADKKKAEKEEAKKEEKKKIDQRG